MRSDTSTRLGAAVLGCWLASCAGPGPADPPSGWGWLGGGARFEQDSDDGPRWGFRIDGSDLVVWRESARIVFEDASPDDGVHFATRDVWMAEPDVTFRTALGEIRWVGPEVLLGDRAWVLAGAEQRVRSAADSRR